MNTRMSGDIGEDMAVEYLCNKGYTIVCRNYRTRKGEIDCIAKSPEGILVFVEVKSSEGKGCGHPFTWIDKSKQKTIIKIAKKYLAEHRITDAQCRFDAIGIVEGNLEHLENCFLA